MGLVLVCLSMPAVVFWGSIICILRPRWVGVREVRTKADQLKVPSRCRSNGGAHATYKTDEILGDGRHKTAGWTGCCWHDTLKENCVDFCPAPLFPYLSYSLKGLDVKVLTQTRLHLSGCFACIKALLSPAFRQILTGKNNPWVWNSVGFFNAVEIPALGLLGWGRDLSLWFCTVLSTGVLGVGTLSYPGL